MKKRGCRSPRGTQARSDAPAVRPSSFLDRFEATDALIKSLSARALGLSGRDRVLIGEAVEELQITLEELQVAGEELAQQAEELSTARLAAEEDRERYLDLFDKAPDAYVVTDAKGVIAEANERAGAMLGVKTRSLLRKPLVLYIDRADRNAFFAKLDGLESSGRLENWEIYFRPRKGHAFPGLIDATPIPMTKDAPAGYRWLVRDATQIKRREEQARLATFPELDPEPVIEVDASGHVFYLNPAAKRLLRGLPEKGLGHPWLAGLPEAAEKLRRSGKRSWNREIKIDGRSFLQSISSPGTGSRIRIYGRDITARKKVEDELLVYRNELEKKVQERTAELVRSTELLERLFASIDLAIAYLDADFNFVRVNRAFADAFGGPPETFTGRNLFALYPDAARQAVFRNVVETGVAHMEFESPFPYGDQRLKGGFWDWSLQRVAAGGAAEGLVLSLVDVTPRIKAEEEGRRLSTAVEQSSEAIVITTKDDHILYVNRTFHDLHGLARRDVIGRKYWEILKLDEEDEAFRERLRRTLDGGETWKGRLTRSLRGQPDRKLDVTVSPVRDPAGAVMNYAVLEHDVTHEHRLETSVRNLQKLDAIGVLAGGIAHDFNNILVPIFINTELAAFEADKDGPLSRYLKLILEAANRGRELVRQIIAFSRPTEQKRDIIDLVAVIKEASRFLRSSIPRSITIVERFDSASGRVRADPTQISQVLMNLGTNAAYAMREQGGRLTIGLGDVDVGTDTAALNPELTAGPYVKLTVGDSGVGMTPEVLDRIFDPFFTTKRRGEGTGMGLPVVRGIVKSHGGAITVSSVPGEGTTFEVYFPAAKGPAGTSRRPADAAPTGTGRILFVDDEDMLVRSVKPMLERLGYTVTATTDPLDALTTLRERPRDFDLVITDETMPGLTGEKLAQEMLRIRPDLPIILATGFSATIREDEILARGIRGFVMKPFSTGEIAEKIRAALKKP